MAKATKTAPQPKRSKAQVEQEFSEIRDEVAAGREAAEPKREEQLRLREAEVRQAVEGITVEGVVQRISGLGLEVSKALAGLSQKLVQEVEQLGAVLLLAVQSQDQARQPAANRE